MLVVDSNVNNSGDFFLTNQNIGIYPDLINNAFINVGGSVSLQEGIGIQSQSYVLAVNGTRINKWTGEIAYPKYRQSNDGGSNSFSLRITHANDYLHHYYYRIGIPYQMKGGEIIGKTIIGGFNSIQIPNFGISCPTRFDFYYKVKLLHSDGTLTDVGNVHFQMPQAGRNNTTFVFDDTNGRVQTYVGNGVEAQEGDYLVVDIEMEYYIVLNLGSNTYNSTADTGNTYSTTYSSRLLPLQISME